MSTQRYISTSFWNDPWILDECTSDERYVYLYLLTSPNSNIAGVYELSLRTAELHTGYDRDQLKRIMERFAEAEKAHYYNGYVIIPKWPTHQRWQQRSKIRDGIVAVLQGLPRDVLEHAKAYGYEFDMDLVDTTIIARNVRQGVSGSLRKAVIDASEGKCARCGKEADKLEIHHIVPVKGGGRNSKDNLEALCIDCHKSVHIPYMDVHNYSDTDTDTDTDTKTNTRSTPSAEADASSEVATVERTTPKPKAATGELKDSVAAAWEHALTQINPSSTWGNYGKERKACNTLAQRTRELVEQTPYEDAGELIQAVVSEYSRMKQRERSPYWRNAPFTPSQVLSRWSAVWDSLAQQTHVEDMPF